MKERYLFRGKHYETGDWEQGFLMMPVHRSEAELSIQSVDYILQSHCRGFSEVDPATIGQCTGLRDKNGVLIFEGDICKDSLGWVFEVTWDSEDARFIGRHSKPRGDTYICYVGRAPTPVEILGNIHDNPELLKGGDTP